MILTTTHAVDGRTVLAYKGLIAAEVVMGVNFVRDAMANLRDVAGGRSATYEREFEAGRTAALEQLEEKARALGADAVVGMRLQYQMLGQENGMMMVAAQGTAVQLARSTEELRRDAARANAEKPIHFVAIDGKHRGPFSTDQIRELVKSGKVDPSAPVSTEGNSDPAPAETLIAGLD